MTALSLDAERRFFAKVKQDGDDPLESCWVWQASFVTAGYGQFLTTGEDGKQKSNRTHRLAYEMLIGPIPEGLVLDHLCRNRACCNPWHLEPVTHRVNLLRGTGCSAVNAAKTECLRGHAFDEANTYVYRGTRQCRKCRRMHWEKWRDSQ